MQQRTTDFSRYPFANVCQVRIPGKLHGLDPAHMRVKVIGQIMSGIDNHVVVIDPQTHDVIVTFLDPQTGHVILEPIHPS